MARMPMGDTPWLHARTRGSDIALIHEDQSATWATLAEASARKARALQAMGIGQGDIVSIALPNGIPFFETAFAAWMVGASVNPLPPVMPLRELERLLDLAKPAVLIGRDPDELSGWRVLPIDWIAIGDGAPFPSLASDHWKVMISGGSTGAPKLIVDGRPAMTDPDLHPLADATDILMPAGGTYLNPGPLYHNAPFTFAFPGLFTGGKVVNLNRFDAEKILATIERHRVDTLYMVPTMMARVAALPEEVRARYDLSSLRHLVHTAAPCPAWLKRRWIDWIGGDHLWEVYGSTESPGITWLNGTEWLAHPGSVGRFKLGSRGRILGADGAELAPGEVGDIYMQPAEGVASSFRYIGAEVHRRDAWDSTGDLGWLDADGYLYLADRRVDLIIRGGSNVYPAEVEAALSEHPAVASCAVIGLPDADMGEKVHAIVELHADAATDPEALRGFMRERLQGYKTPSSWEFVDSPLRDAAGKVRRSALRAERIGAAQVCA